METVQILVIEDDDLVARTIERALSSARYEVRRANEGKAGLEAARQRRPALVILDVLMPGMDGYAVCRQMRADPSLADVPVLFLTAKVKDEDRITGFRAGGDDYLCKPFNIDELLLRVKAILKRTRYSPPPALADNPTTHSVDRQRLNVGEYSLDTRTFELHIPGTARIRLTPVQFDLLYHLMLHPEEVFSPGRLLDEVWDYPSGVGSPDLVRVHIKTLRERIEKDPHRPTFIRTIPGYGYTVGAFQSGEA